jgi:hypothetical protein
VARKRRTKAETPAPTSAIALQASIVLEAIKSGAVEARDVQSALVASVERTAPLVAQALARLFEEDPDAFLKHWTALAEFKTPRVQRVEHRIEGEVKHSHFVAVERREVDPRVLTVDAVVVPEGTSVVPEGTSDV